MKICESVSHLLILEGSFSDDMITTGMSFSNVDSWKLDITFSVIEIQKKKKKKIAQKNIFSRNFENDSIFIKHNRCFS